MKRFLLLCSGANSTVLKACPTDESKYVGMGAIILLTATLTCLSGGYALFTVFRSIPAAVAVGVLWGMVIFNMDRVIVSGMRKQKHFALDLLYAAPRIAIAILLALVIARPLELKFFEVEIQDRWAQMQIDTRRADFEQIRAGDGVRLAELGAENARLESEMAAERREYHMTEEAWIREKEGTAGTGISGAGPVFQEKSVALEEARRQMEDAETRNRPRIQQNEAEINRLKDRQNQIITQTQDIRNESLGFLARMETFGALKEKSKTIALVSLFITLLFILLETAPVVVKLLSTLSPYRPYDELLEQREFELVEAARQKVRIREHELKVEADRKISEQKAMMELELHLSTVRNQLRLNSELRVNEVLMQQIAGAQVEVADHLVKAWKQREIERIGVDVGA